MNRVELYALVVIASGEVLLEHSPLLELMAFLRGYLETCEENSPGVMIVRQAELQTSGHAA